MRAREVLELLTTLLYLRRDADGRTLDAAT